MKKVILQWGAGMLVSLLLCSSLAIASETTGTIDTGVSTGINGTVIVSPTFSPSAGSYSSTQTVSLTATGSTAICYRTDGTDPACLTSTTCATSSTLYSSSFSVSSTRTIKARSCYPGNGGTIASSSVSSAAYTISSGGGGGGGGIIISNANTNNSNTNNTNTNNNNTNSNNTNSSSGNGNENVNVNGIFEDINNHWAQTYIEVLASKGVVEGYSINGKRYYKPDVFINRAEFVKILVTALYGELSAPSADPFSDVSKDTWFAPYVAKAKELGWIEGYVDKTFKPTQNISRAEAVKVILLSKYTLSEISGGVNIFPDVETGSWYEKYVVFAVLKNIVNGYADGTFRPGHNLTRAEMGKIVVNVHYT